MTYFGNGHVNLAGPPRVALGAGVGEKIGVTTLIVGGSILAYSILGPIETWLSVNVGGLQRKKDYKWIAKRNAFLGGGIGVFLASMYLINPDKKE